MTSQATLPESSRRAQLHLLAYWSVTPIMGLVEVSGNENPIHWQFSKLGSPLKGAITRCLKFTWGGSREPSHGLSRENHQKQKTVEITILSRKSVTHQTRKPKIWRRPSSATMNLGEGGLNFPKSIKKAMLTLSGSTTECKKEQGNHVQSWSSSKQGFLQTRVTDAYAATSERSKTLPDKRSTLHLKDPDACLWPRKASRKEGFGKQHHGTKTKPNKNRFPKQELPVSPFLCKWGQTHWC